MTNMQSRDELHYPRRAEQMLDLEEHLNISANLTRALFELITSNCFPSKDARTLEAVREIADQASDHASAARYAFNLLQNGKYNDNGHA